MTSMQYADGTITTEDDIPNFRIRPGIVEMWPSCPVYVVTLDNGNKVNIARTVKSMEHAKVGDRIRVGNKTGRFDKGNKGYCCEYYNLSRGPPPMMPLKKYTGEVHKGGDGCDYTIEYDDSGKCGRYYWRKIKEF